MNKLTVSEYSERAIVVRGETKPHKDALRNIGGKFNPHLRDGAGWIFSKHQWEAVNFFVQKQNNIPSANGFTTPPQVSTITPSPSVEEEVKTIVEVNKQVKTKKAVAYTDVICEGFLEGTFRLPNSKVEQFVKQTIKARNTHFKDLNMGDERPPNHKCKFTFVNVK